MNSGNTVIAPTVGRVVWYYPAAGDSLRKNVEADQPLAAQVAKVHPDGRVNLGVLDQYGNNHSRLQVELVQAGEPKPLAVSYCTWMPYQLGQAARTQQLEKSS